MNHIGYLAPDGTHHPCKAWEHAALARRLTGQGALSFLSVRDDGTMPPDAEQVLDRAGYVRIEKNDRNDPGALSWAARYYDPDATLTEAQQAWLRAHGYGRLLRDLLSMQWPDLAEPLIAPESPDEVALMPRKEVLT